MCRGHFQGRCRRQPSSALEGRKRRKQKEKKEKAGYRAVPAPSRRLENPLVLLTSGVFRALARALIARRRRERCRICPHRPARQMRARFGHAERGLFKDGTSLSLDSAAQPEFKRTLEQDDCRQNVFFFTTKTGGILLSVFLSKKT